MGLVKGNRYKIHFIIYRESVANAIFHVYVKPQSHQIVRFVDRTIGCDLVSYDRSAMFAAISFNNDRTLWFILYDWL